MASTKQPLKNKSQGKKLDIARAVQSQTHNLLLQYQQAWDHELGGDPRLVFIGIAIALGVFVFLGSLPWVVSYLQDNEIIKPKVHWSDLRQRHYQNEEISPPEEEVRDGPFGRPRK